MRHRARVRRFLFHAQCLGVQPRDAFPPSREAVQCYVVFRLEEDGVQPSTVKHDLSALRCAVHQVQFLPLGWDSEAILARCRMAFAYKGAVRLYARPAKRQRPVETEEMVRIVEWVRARPKLFHWLCLLSYLLNYFGLLRRGAVQWMSYEMVPGTRCTPTAGSNLQFAEWRQGRCVHFVIDKDKNLLGGVKRVTIPDHIPLLGDRFSFCALLEAVLARRTRDYGCLMGCSEEVFADRDQRTFQEKEWARSKAIVREVTGDAHIATTAFRRGFAWALYRHDVSRDKLADIGFWSHDSNAMDVYHQVSAQERCEHITAVRIRDVVEC